MSWNRAKKLVLFFLCIYLICFCLFFYSHPIKALSHWDWVRGINKDFNIYERAARNFINDTNIYKDYKYRYPPFFAILFSALLIFPAKFQVFIWVGLNIIITVLLWFLLLKYFPQGRKKYQTITIAFLTIISSIPVLHNFKWGQVSILIFLLVLISYIAFKKEKFLISGLALAIASSIKIIPAIFLLFYMVNWKKKMLKLIKWFIIFFAFCLLLLPFSFLGYEKTCRYYETYYKRMTAKNEWVSYAVWNNQTITGILFRYLSKDYALLKFRKTFPRFPNPPPHFLPLYTLLSRQEVRILGIFISLSLLTLTLYLSRKKHYLFEIFSEDDQDDLLFCLFISGFFVFTNQAWVHYYVFLILPYYLMFISLLKKDLKVYLFSFTLFFLSFIAINGNIFLVKSTYLLELFEYLGLFYWTNVLLFLSLIFYLKREQQLRMVLIIRNLVQQKKPFGEITKILYPKEYLKLKEQRRCAKMIKKLDDRYQQLLQKGIDFKTAYSETYGCDKASIKKGINLKIKKIWHLFEKSKNWTEDGTIK